MGAGMDESFARRIEWIASVAAAAVLAAAAGFAAGRLTPSPMAVGGAAGSAFVIALLALRSIGSSNRDFPLTHFAPAEMVFEELDELLLTDADRVDQDNSAEGELVLDDILANLGEDSRVVRLFDASAMPTPGQLRAQVDRHLGQARAANEAADASAALHEALAELRSSLK